ncbi:MAG: GNAT family N-acetyltransferase [Acidimicrobiia bacterium]
MTDRQEDDAPNVKVRNDPENRQFAVEVDGRAAGKAEYRLRGETYLFIHTEVDPEFQGLGVANRLARSALDDVRGQGRTLVPLCPFIAAYIKRHPEYDDLVDHEMTKNLMRRRDAKQ